MEWCHMGIINKIKLLNSKFNILNQHEKDMIRAIHTMSTDQQNKWFYGDITGISCASMLASSLTSNKYTFTYVMDVITEYYLLTR